MSFVFYAKDAKLPIIAPGLAAVLWILSPVLISLGTAGQAPQDATRAPLPPGVGIRTDATPKIATVGDPIRIDIDVTMPAGCRVEIPRPDAQAGDFAILDFLPGPVASSKRAQTGPLEHHRARIITAIYKTGKFAFPSLPMKLITAEGTEIALSSPAVDIEIESVLRDANPALKDLKRQAEIPEPAHWALWLILALGGLMLGAVAWRFSKRRRNRPSPPAPDRDPLDLAAADLEDLLGRGLPDRAAAKQFYVRLSDIAKRILESGYAIHTTERTTSEIMESLQTRASLEPENSKRIESFLLGCDVVKFAKYVPSKIEHAAASKDAFEILAEARKARSAGRGQAAVESGD